MGRSAEWGREGLPGPVVGAWVDYDIWLTRL
eukprot:COSAG06_NODE_57890_length_279_cov_0.477778_1_plen_30_part_01